MPRVFRRFTRARHFHDWHSPVVLWAMDCGQVSGGVLMADFAAHPNEKLPARPDKIGVARSKTRTRGLDAACPLGLNTASHGERSGEAERFVRVPAVN